MSFNDSTTWTYGCEHEFADWDRRWKLPTGCSVDENDYTIVNSNGISADPKGKLYGFGGEIKSPPSKSITGQLNFLKSFVAGFRPSVNYRSNLHCHIRVPGLKEDLDTLKQIRKFEYFHSANVYNEIARTTQPREPRRCRKDLEYDEEVWLKARARRIRRCAASHFTTLTAQRYHAQQLTGSVSEFFEAEVPISGEGRPLWHLGVRPAINLRQLMDTDTVEFRWFYGTTDPRQLDAALTLCHMFLWAALNEDMKRQPVVLSNLPRRSPFCLWQEVGYRATNPYVGSVNRAEAVANVGRIKKRSFDFYSEENLGRAVR